METIDKHVKEDGHTKAVTSHWATFQDACKNVGLAQGRFPNTLKQHFYLKNSKTLSPTDGGPVQFPRNKDGNVGPKKSSGLTVKVRGVHISDPHVLRGQITGDLKPGDLEIRLDDSPRMSEDPSCASSPLGSSKKRKAEKEVDATLHSPELKKYLSSATPDKAKEMQAANSVKAQTKGSHQVTGLEETGRASGRRDGADRGAVEDDVDVEEQADTCEEAEEREDGPNRE